MPVFEFKDYNLDLTIAGNEFTVNCVAELADKVREHRDTLANLANELRAGKKTSADAIDLCREIIDDILGDSAFDSIFKGRTPTVTDCSDVLLFTIGAITDQFKKQTPYPGNREARRSAGKTAGAKK
mgnify:CR=1 FL=1